MGLNVSLCWSQQLVFLPTATSVRQMKPTYSDCIIAVGSILEFVAVKLQPCTEKVLKKLLFRTVLIRFLVRDILLKFDVLVLTFQNLWCSFYIFVYNGRKILSKHLWDGAQQKTELTVCCSSFLLVGINRITVTYLDIRQHICSKSSSILM